MNIDSISGLISGGIGAVTVLGIFLTLILAGRLVTKDSHDEALVLKDAVIAVKDITIADKDKQIEVLTQAVGRERERADAGVLAANVAKDMMQGLRKVVN